MSSVSLHAERVAFCSRRGELSMHALHHASDREIRRGMVLDLSRLATRSQVVN